MGGKRGTKDWEGQETCKKQNGKSKSKYINDYIKCKWSKCPSQKAEIIRLDKKANPTIYCL